VFLKVTWYVPAAGTEIAVGVKPRSNASIAMVPAAAAAAATGLPTGWSAATAGGLARAGAYVHEGPAALEQPAATMAMTATMGRR
jgi:hypothetical protein